MNKFVFSALATTVVGATGFADTDWPELDRELAALNRAPLALEHHEGLHVSGWLIASIGSDDTPSDTVNDDLGTGVNSAAVNLSGTVGSNYTFALGWNFTDTNELFAPGGIPTGSSFNATTMTFDSSSGLGGLTDAYVSVGIGETLDLKIGAFRRMFLASSNVQRNHTLFIDRSYLGGMYSYRDAGVALSGNFDRLNWEVTLTNGHSDTQDDFAYSAHLDLDILGTSQNAEGALRSAEGTNLNVGVTFADDGGDTNSNDDLLAGGDGTGSNLALGTTRDSALLAGYATLTAGGFTVWGEMVDQDTDATSAGYQGPTGTGATPWSAGLAFLFGENYEVAFRYDDWDNGPTNTTRMNLGLNRYIDGHDIKWQLNFSTGSDDTINGATENDVLALGLAVGF